MMPAEPSAEGRAPNEHVIQLVRLEQAEGRLHQWHEAPCVPLELSDRIVSIHASCSWRDQGWGNRKGRMRLVVWRGGQIVCTQDLFGVAGHEETSPTADFDGDSAIATLARPGDTITVQYMIGGGGGHRIAIRDLRVVVRTEPPPPEVMADLAGMLPVAGGEPPFSDVNLVADDGTAVRAHRFMLAARSPVLRVELLGPFLHTEGEDLRMEGVGSAALKAIVRHMYTDEIDEEVLFENLAELVMASMRYQLELLFRTATSFAASRLTVDNALDMLALADSAGDADFLQRMEGFVTSHRDELRDTEAFLALPAARRMALGIPGDVPEDHRTYSSVYANDAVGSGHARSRLDSIQAWCAAALGGEEWCELDLGADCLVAGLLMRGRFDFPGDWDSPVTLSAGTGADARVVRAYDRFEYPGQWVTSVDVSTARNGAEAGEWVAVQPAEDSKATEELPGAFRGCESQHALATVRFAERVVARYVRIVVRSFCGHPSLRVAALLEAEE